MRANFVGLRHAHACGLVARRAALSPPPSTSILTSTQSFAVQCFLSHDTKSAGQQEHQEGPARIVELRERLSAMPSLAFRSDFELASDATLGRVHSTAYLSALTDVERGFRSEELEILPEEIDMVDGMDGMDEEYGE